MQSEIGIWSVLDNVQACAQILTCGTIFLSSSDLLLPKQILRHFKDPASFVWIFSRHLKTFMTTEAF